MRDVIHGKSIAIKKLRHRRRRVKYKIKNHLYCLRLYSSPRLRISHWYCFFSCSYLKFVSSQERILTYYRYRYSQNTGRCEFRRLLQILSQRIESAKTLIRGRYNSANKMTAEELNALEENADVGEEGEGEREEDAWKTK